MANENLIVAVQILAYNYASAAFAKLGVDAAATTGVMGMATAGAVGLGAAIAAISVASTVAASSFDQQMHKIGALTDTSAEQMKWYTQQILALAPQLDVAPTKLAEGLYFVISAGQKGTQAIDTLRYSAMAAAAGMTDFSGVADAVTSVMNAYRQSGLDAGTATDVLTKTVVNGKTTWSALVSSIGITATTSAAAGIKVQEMGAALSALSQVAGSHATRRIGMEFMNLERNIGIDVDGLAKRAKQLKLTFDEGAFAAAPLIDKLRILAQATGGIGYLNMDAVKSWAAMTDAERASTKGQQELALATAHANSMFKSMVGGAAAFIPAAILLSDKGAEYTHILDQMTTHGQATQQAFDVMRESTGQKWNMFKVTLDSLAVAIGLHLLPAVNNLLMGFIGLGRYLIDVMENHWDLIRNGLIGIAIVVATLLAPALWSATAAILPWIAIFAAVAAAGILVGWVVQQLVAHFGGWDAIMKRLQPTIKIIQDAFRQVQKAFADAFNDPATKDAIKQLQQALPQLLPVLELLGIVIVGALVIGFQLFMAVLKALAGALPGLATMIAGFFQFIGGWVEFFTDLFHGNFDRLVPDLAQVFMGLLHVFEGAGMAIVGWLGGFFGQFLSIWGLKWSDVGKALASTWEDIKRNVAASFQWLLTSAGQWGGQLLLNFINGIKSQFAILTAVLGSVKDIVNHVLQGKSPPPGWPEQGQFGPTLVKNFADGIIASRGQLSAAMGQLMAAAQTPLSATVGVGAAGGALLGGVGGGTGTQNVTINATFPNVTNKEEIKAAFAEMQRGNYLKTQNPGKGALWGARV